MGASGSSPKDRSSSRQRLRLTRLAQELAEESGLLGDELHRLGHLNAAYSYSNQGFDDFLATGLSQGDPQPSVEDQDLRSARLEDRQFEANSFMARTNL